VEHEDDDQIKKTSNSKIVKLLNPYKVRYFSFCMALYCRCETDPLLTGWCQELQCWWTQSRIWIGIRSL